MLLIIFDSIGLVDTGIFGGSREESFGEKPIEGFGLWRLLGGIDVDRVIWGAIY